MWGTLNKQGVNLSNTNLSLIYREYYSEMVCVKKCTHIHTHTYTKHFCGSNQHNESILNLISHMNSILYLGFSLQRYKPQIFNKHGCKASYTVQFLLD
jgi:hypothetical protein